MSASPLSRPRGVVASLESTPKGRYVRIVLAEPVRVPYAHFVNRLMAAGCYPDVPPAFDHAPWVKSLRLSARELAARDIREGDTVELGLTWSFRPTVLGPVLSLRPGWAVPFAPAAFAAREVCHA